jgi:Na+/H+-dicarboxylate symporter
VGIIIDIHTELPYISIIRKQYLVNLSIDQFLVMGRAATNVIGKSIATAVVAKWE